MLFACMLRGAWISSKFFIYFVLSMFNEITNVFFPSCSSFSKVAIKAVTLMSVEQPLITPAVFQSALVSVVRSDF